MILVRPASPNDAEAILRLEEQAFTSDRMSRRSIRRLIKSPSARVMVAVAGAQVCATMVLLLRRNSRSVRIYSMAVDRLHRQKGIASQLLTYAEALTIEVGASTLKLEVRKGNQQAERLYQRQGYVKQAELPSYYSDGADAVSMEKQVRT
jgi:[ribosomal protein S18]-alanine N-acetyltransferase